MAHALLPCATSTVATLRRRLSIFVMRCLCWRSARVVATDAATASVLFGVHLFSIFPEGTTGLCCGCGSTALCGTRVDGRGRWRHALAVSRLGRSGGAIASRGNRYSRLEARGPHGGDCFLFTHKCRNGVFCVFFFPTRQSSGIAPTSSAGQAVAPVLTSPLPVLAHRGPRVSTFSACSLSRCIRRTLFSIR